MIDTISDLLLKLKDKEQELLKKYNIVKHPGIIGDMYEGLTKDILSKSIFNGLDIQVRAGKIKNSKNQFSGEIDCMIVIGEGEKIPYTDKYIYDSSKVIAVIQVKKKLFSKDIKDSYENLRTVIKVTEPRQGEQYHYRLLRDSWRLICKEELPLRENLIKISAEKQHLYHVLLMEAFYPSRIVWGYNGFKSEFSLRNHFADYLEENISTEENKGILGFGPLNFPNLIICDKYSLIKTNGIPFAHPLFDDSWWPFFVSSYENPVYFLLEIIWTRLHYMFGITSEIFGEDMTVDEMHGFLLCRYKETEKIKGWEYYCVPAPKDLLEKPLEHEKWKPTFVDETQFIILNQLCEKGVIDCKGDAELKGFVEKQGYTLESFIESLKETGLVDITDQVLSLITEECICGIAPDGRYFAGDNKSGRVTRWTLQIMDKKAIHPLTNRDLQSL